MSRISTHPRNVLHLLLSSVWSRRVLPCIATLLVLVANWMVFAYVPNEAIMGAVQRIFYFHVGAAVASYVMIFVLFSGSVAYLATRFRIWDALAESGAVVGFALCSIVLLSGMIWGHSAWNTWWRWEPRLVSFLVLWFVMLSYIVLRKTMSGREQERTFAAVLGILAAVHIPVVVFSIHLLSQTEQLHPQVIARQGLSDPRMSIALMVSILAMIVVSIWIAVVRWTARLLEYEVDDFEDLMGGVD